MINVNIKLVFTSRKLLQTLSVKEKKPPIVNTQCVVYSFQCDLCDANYVGFTARHLHQRISEHRYSAIGKHLETQLIIKEQRSITSLSPKEMQKQVRLPNIRDARCSLNTQSDSIRAKLFTWHFRFFCVRFVLFGYYTLRTHKYFYCFTSLYILV